jgi:Double zinc ribbon
MHCPSCGFDNPEGMNFCGKCANPLSPRCPQCGFENPAGFAFCGKCATPLSPQSQQSSVQGLESSVQGRESEAEECFSRAIEIAQRQQAKSLELRAVMSLSRLWRQQDKKKEAHQMLSEIYNWFTEGFDTKDLQEARAPLKELSH